MVDLLERNYHQAALAIYEQYFQANDLAIDDELITRTFADSKRNLDKYFNIHNKHITKVIVTSDSKLQVWEPIFQWV